MTVKDLINYSIPPLKLSDNLLKAQDWMSEFHVHELPIVDGGKFLGFFNESLLFDDLAGAQQIGDFKIISEGLHLNQDEHFYALLKIAIENESNIVAVLDENNNYIGAVTTQDVIEAFSKMSSIKSPGTIIIMNIPFQDYSMNEISRLVEAEGGRVLSSFIDILETEGNLVKLTLKIDLENGSSIISAFERFGYQIISIFGKGDEDQLEKERLDTLLHYLQI